MAVFLEIPAVCCLTSLHLQLGSPPVPPVAHFTFAQLSLVNLPSLELSQEPVQGQMVFRLGSCPTHVSFKKNTHNK